MTIEEANRRLLERRQAESRARAGPTLQIQVPPMRTDLTEEEINAKIREEDERDAFKRREEIRAITGVPHEHWHKTDLDWDSPWGRKTKAIIERVIRQPSVMIALISKMNGGGKTQCAVEVIRRAVEAKMWSRYIRAMELFMALKFSKADSFDHPDLAKFSKVRLLVIDEVHINSASWSRDGERFVQDMLTTLIDVRYGSGLATIMIGNVDEDSLLELLGSNAYSRLTEKGGVIKMEDKNWRVS